MDFIFPAFLMNPYVAASVPLTASFFHLIFYVIFRFSTESDEKKALNKPLLSIITGISVFIFFHLIGLVNLLTIEKFEWPERVPGLFALGTIPMLTIAIGLILFFYFRFYWFLDSYSKNKPEDVRTV
jgi:hypothetical protein